MLNKDDVVCFTEKKENVNKIAKSFDGQKKIYRTMGNIGGVLTSYAGPVFIGSLLCPFDIEGPVIEIISGVAFAIGKIMKSIAINKMEEIKIRQTEEDYYNFDYDNSDRPKSR